jgi:tRNA-dependent cyclodipeptide synthase
MIVIPPQYKQIVKETKGTIGWMGLSVGKKQFERTDVMKEYIEFMDKQFSESYFIIADWPKKYNYMAINNTKEEHAEKKSLEQGEKLKTFLTKLTSNLPNTHILTWLETRDEHYEHISEIIDEGYEEDHTFKKDCKTEVSTFLSLENNLKKILKHSTVEEAYNTSKNYFLEELKLILSFHQQFGNGATEIYPGRNSVQEHIREGKYSFCKHLELTKFSFFEAHYKPTPLQVEYEDIK